MTHKDPRQDPTVGVPPNEGSGSDAGGTGGGGGGGGDDSGSSPFYGGDPPPRRQPDRIGPYRVIHEIGEGGMGIVYLAVLEDGHFKRRVAIKVLKPGMDTDDILRRFELERQVLGAMNHPNIARLYDAGETDDGRPYIIMEYVEGRDIRHYCDVHRLEIDERLKLFKQICSAVHYAHQNLVVHRDLKPSNILVTKDGRPKLLDFGIAKLVNPEMVLIPPDSTAPQLRIMTPEYASPEQVLGDPITTASDVYSLGVLCYELLSGHRPYRFKTRLQDEIRRIVCDVDPDKPSTWIGRTEDIPPTDATATGTTTITPDTVSRARVSRPPQLRRRLAGDLDNIILMAMRKEPQRRYASAEQFSQDLSRHLAGKTVAARPDTLLYRTAKFVRRNRAGVAAAAIVLLTLIAGIVATAAMAEQREVARAKAEEHRDRVVQIAATLVHDINRAIDVEGATVARRRLLETVLPTLDELTTEAPDNPTLRKLQAQAHDQLGDLLIGPLAAVREAMTHYETASAIREELHTRWPDDPSLRRSIDNSDIRVGTLLAGVGETDLALRHFDTVLARRRSDPVEMDHQAMRDLFIAMRKVSDVEGAKGNTARATALLEESIAAQRLLLQGPLPEDVRLVAREDMAETLRRIAYAQSESGEQSGLTTYLEALDFNKRCLATRPQSAKYARLLMTGHHFVAQAAFDEDDRAMAIEHAMLAEQIGEEQLDADPENKRVVRNLIGVRLLLGTLQSTDHVERGLSQWRWCLSAAQGLVTAAPEISYYQLLLADSDAQLGEGLRLAGDPMARRHLEDAIDIYRRMPRDQRDEPSYAAVLVSMSRFMAELDDPQAAVTYAEQAVEVDRSADVLHWCAQTLLANGQTDKASPLLLEARDDADGDLLRQIMVTIANTESPPPE